MGCLVVIVAYVALIFSFPWLASVLGPWSLLLFIFGPPILGGIVSAWESTYR